jgi:hypothetical protein
MRNTPYACIRGGERGIKRVARSKAKAALYGERLSHIIHIQISGLPVTIGQPG